MARNDEFLNALRNANPIEDVVGSYVTLKRQGRNTVCNCPFHSEKTPSCTIFHDTQSFYCFGCGAGGDVITFIMRIENLDFVEAMKLLAQRGGLEIPEYDSQNSQKAKLRTRIYEMNRLAANFFYTNLLKGPDKSGLDYFRKRQLTPATVKKYGLGFAPNSWDSLVNYLNSKGYNNEEIAAAWLGGVSQKSGKMFDMFRNRVVFPIVDLRGNVIAFGGRVLDDSKPKYLNTAFTPVFDKGNNLFSLNFAKNSSVKQLILCEGYMDVVALNQAGFENAVATLGTAITPDQARIMSHYAEEVIIAYDSDGAGQRAAQKAINHLSDVGVKTRILRMEGAKDPDEYIKKFGASRFRMLIEGSSDALVYMLNRCEEGIDISTEAGKVDYFKRASKILAEINSQYERRIYISTAAKKSELPVEMFESYIKELLTSKEKSVRKNESRAMISSAVTMRDEINPDAVQYKREAKAEEALIYYILSRPEDAESVSADAPPEIFITAFNKKVYSALLEKMKNTDRFSLSLLADEFTPDEMGRISGIEARHRTLNIDSVYINDCISLLKKHSSQEKHSQGSDISIEEINSLFKSKNKPQR